MEANAPPTLHIGIELRSLGRGASPNPDKITKNLQRATHSLIPPQHEKTCRSSIADATTKNFNAAHLRVDMKKKIQSLPKLRHLLQEMDLDLNTLYHLLLELY